MRLAKVIAVASLVFLAGCDREPPGQATTATARRLTDVQYRQTIADIFGADIKVVGRIEPDVRADGLIAIGTTKVSVTPIGLEQYDVLARGIADEVFAEGRRNRAIECAEASAPTVDKECAASFAAQVGRRIFRRPLSEAEISRWQGVAVSAAGGDIYRGLRRALAGMLVSPDFLFRIEETEPDPAAPGTMRLDDFGRASRLSFFLWNAPPDDKLLEAAALGELRSPRGVRTQVDRMIASPRLADGIRAFFYDFLEFDSFDALAKDPQLFPKFSRTVIEDAQEQTLMAVTDHVLTRRADYRDIFTTPHTFMTRALGMVYDVPVTSRGTWEAFEFAKDDPRAGLLTQISFLALHSHSGRSSPTLRGKAIREIFLCQSVPMPPPNVNFTLVEDTANPQLKTARGRLGAHSSDATCAGCHRITDPIGLALEKFDSLGAMRQRENGEAIDASGELDGAKFDNALGLGKAIHDNPATASCLVSKLYRYASGQTNIDGPWMTWLSEGFARDGYRIPDLFHRIATSDAFFRIKQAPSRASAEETME